MRAVALLALAVCCMPRAASGQGLQAAGRMVAFSVRLEVRRLSEISFVQPVDIQFVMEQPNRGRHTPMSRVAGGGRIGTVAGWLVGLAVGPALFSGHDMGCDDIECYGAISSTEALVAGAVVGGGVGYLLGSVLALVTDLDVDLLKVVQMDVSPKGKPGLKVKASIRF